MKNYIKIPIEKITRRPSNPAGYLCIQNKYWPLDNDNNTFLTTTKHAVCSGSRITAEFYIKRMELPVRTELIYYASKKYKKPVLRLLAVAP